MKKLSICIADRHPVVREGLKQILAKAGDFAVTAEAANGQQTLEKAIQNRLDLLVLERFGHTLASGGRRAGADLAESPVEELGPVAAEEADYSLRLADVLKEDLRLHEMLDLCETIEMPLIPVLVEMESTGILIDPPFFEELSSKLRR